MNTDLATQEGAETFFEAMRRMARDWFERKESHRVMAFVMATTSWGQVEIGEGKIGILQLIPEGREAFDTFDCTITAAIEGAKAIGVILVGEAWMVPAEDLLSDPDREALFMGEKRISEHPKRVECVHLTMEHIRTEPATWVATISRDAAGKATLGPFEKQQYQQSIGRFTGLLHKERFS